MIVSNDGFLSDFIEIVSNNSEIITKRFLK